MLFRQSAIKGRAAFVGENCQTCMVMPIYAQCVDDLPIYGRSELSPEQIGLLMMRLNNWQVLTICSGDGKEDHSRVHLRPCNASQRICFVQLWSMMTNHKLCKAAQSMQPITLWRGSHTKCHRSLRMARHAPGGSPFHTFEKSTDIKPMMQCQDY